MSNGTQAVTAGGFLGALSKINGLLTLATSGAGILVPVVTGIITLIEQHTNAAGEVEFTVVLKLGQGELDHVMQVSNEEITAINDELTRLGHPNI